MSAADLGLELAGGGAELRSSLEKSRCFDNKTP